MRLRRARTVLVYWREAQLVFENFRTRVAIAADPMVWRILSFFDQWRRPEELASAMPQHTPRSVRAALRQLTRNTFLVSQGSVEAQQDDRLEKIWSAWLPHGGAFHFGTKDEHFVGAKRRASLLKCFLNESPQPAFFKNGHKASRVRLPPQDPPEGEFLQVLMARQTQRKFSPQSLPLGSVSDLLFYTWGVTGYVHSDLLGRLPHKTSPSAGARHPVEVYLAALRVDGLAPGLYHYNGQRHCLEQLRCGHMEKKAAEYCAGQAYVRSAAALFLMTAVFPRAMWKYRFPRAYRTVLLDAGHLCQTFYLVATWLGLAPFCTAALKDSLIEKDLGLDGISESVLYVAGVGVPRAGASA